MRLTLYPVARVATLALTGTNPADCGVCYLTWPAATTNWTTLAVNIIGSSSLDEVFIGSCMTNIGHFRAAGKLLDGKTDLATRLWIAPPTKMDAYVLTQEGYYGILGRTGARMEMPGCSLCMGNQAQVRKGSTAMSTSTRNFPNRLGLDTRVYLGSAELASICALLGKIPTVAEYTELVGVIAQKSADIYRYMNFDQIADFREVADTVTV